MSLDFTKLSGLYKAKKFKELLEEINELEQSDEVVKNFKIIILSNALLNVKEDKTGIIEEYQQLAIDIINSGIDLTKQISINDNIYSLAYIAIMVGDLEILQALINNGFDVNHIERGANLLFHTLSIAESASHSDIANYLIDQNIEIMPFKNHPSILNIAIVNYKKIMDKDIVSKILNKGYNFDFEYDKVEDPIILALKYDVNIVNKILDSNYKFNLTRGSLTPLEMYSIQSKNIDIELFERIAKKIKADIGTLNYGLSNSIPAIHILISDRKKDYLKILLDLGVDVNVRVVLKDSMAFTQYNISGMTPLVYATTAGFYDIVELLLEYQADPSIKDLMQKSPIFISQNANRETFLALMKSGKIDLTENISNVREHYKSPLHVLASMKEKEAINIMETILKNYEPSKLGEIINKQTSNISNEEADGLTPLMIACAIKNKDMINVLVNDDRVNLNISNKIGERALSLLFSPTNEYFNNLSLNSNKETVEMITAHQQNEELTELKDDNLDKFSDDTLLIGKMLINKGADVNFKILGSKFIKTLSGENRTIINEYINKDKKSFFDKILGK